MSLFYDLDDCGHDDWEYENVRESCGKGFRQESCRKCDMQKSTLVYDYNASLIEKDHAGDPLEDPKKPRYWRH